MYVKFICTAAALILLQSCTEQKSDLVFSRRSEGGQQLYLMHADGSTGLLNDSLVHSQGAVTSHAGNRLLYAGELQGNWDIYSYDLRSNQHKRITTGPGIESFPAWSTDDTKAAYMSAAPKRRDILASDLDGNQSFAITDDQAIDLEPLWSPSEETTVYFKSLRDGYEGLYKKDLSSGIVEEIGSTGSGNKLLQAVPGSSELSYVQYSASAQKMMTVDGSGSNRFELLQTDKPISAYDWSADGTKLAIAMAGQVEVYSYDRKQGLELVHILPQADDPAFAPKADRLYFVRQVEGVRQIFSATPLGKDLQQHTADPVDSYAPLPL